MARGPYFPPDWQQSDGVKASDDAWKNQYMLNLKSRLITPVTTALTGLQEAARDQTSVAANSRRGKELMTSMIANLKSVLDDANSLNNLVVSGKAAEIKIVDESEIEQPIRQLDQLIASLRRIIPRMDNPFAEGETNDVIKYLEHAQDTLRSVIANL